MFDGEDIPEDGNKVFHKEARLTLFRKIIYHVIVGENNRDMAKKIESEYGDVIQITMPTHSMGYSCNVGHPIEGTNFYIFINTTSFDEFEEEIKREAVHQAVHTSWQVIDYLGTKISKDDHELQAVLIEEFYSKIMECVNEAVYGNLGDV